MNAFTKFFGGIADGFRAAQLHGRLDRMSDRRLEDIGLNRQDLPRKAMEWATRR